MREAFREYPFATSVIYAAPVQLGPANPLYSTATGYHATMCGFPYDDLDKWRGPYPSDVFAAQFEKMAERWRRGVVELEFAVQTAPSNRQEEVQSELRRFKAN